MLYRILKLASVLTLVVHANVLRAERAGMHIAFKGLSMSQDCEDIWRALKTDNYPQFKSLESLGGVVYGPDESVCDGYKNIHGTSQDLVGYLKIVKSFADRYEIKELYIVKSRLDGLFDSADENFQYPLSKRFKTFDELFNFLAEYKSLTAKNIAAFFRKNFGAEKYAKQLEAHFASGQCLHDFTMAWDWFAFVSANEELKIAQKQNLYPEICP